MIEILVGLGVLAFIVFWMLCFFNTMQILSGDLGFGPSWFIWLSHLVNVVIALAFLGIVSYALERLIIG